MLTARALGLWFGEHLHPVSRFRLIGICSKSPSRHGAGSLELLQGDGDTGEEQAAAGAVHRAESLVVPRREDHIAEIIAEQRTNAVIGDVMTIKGGLGTIDESDVASRVVSYLVLRETGDTQCPLAEGLGDRFLGAEDIAR